ncbi:MAG: DUF5915 domain-containing protein, partial [Eubacteriales bacterium]|nr:DUF5915 domain-containing protein [Eubacteriales bacterium]
IDSFNINEHPIEQVNLSLMDQWVLSKLNTLIKTVDSGLESYKVPETARAIAEFTDELSNWYVRRSRERFWGKGMAGDKEAAFSTLYTVLSTLSRVIAPFLPFLSEELYQNLVRSVDKDAPESVHLTSFPVCEQKYIDADMEKQMDALIEVAQLGRACRNLASMKVRQPSKALYVKGARFDEKYAELVEDELNVKSVVFTDDAREFTTYHLKPQMRTLGPKYGKLLGKIGARLGEMDGNEVVEAFDRGETLHFDVDGTEVCLEKNDVLTEPMQKEGFVAQTDASVTVVLDTNLTPELIREGYAREVVSKLQTMRKEAGFDVSDRINVWYTAGAEVSGAVEALKDTITSGVLALSMTAGEPDEGAVVKEWDINGKPATLCVKQVK